MTRVDLFNQALALIGAEPISSETQKDRNGRECRRHYATSCRNILEQFEWSCAMTRAELTAVDEEDAAYNADLTPYEYQYPLPEDCIRVIAINEKKDTKRLVERRYLYTDADEVILSYIADVTEPEDPADDLPFPDTLCDAISRLMAYRMSPLVSPKENRQLLLAEYQRALIDAMDADGRERTEDNEATEWIV